MPYGTLKADTIAYYTATGDVSLAISGLIGQGAAVISGTSGIFTTVSGTTVTGNTGQFGTVTAVSGIFTTSLSGATITGTSGQFGTVTGTSGQFGTVTGNAGVFTTVTGSSGLFTNNLTAAAFIPTGTGIPTNGWYLPSGNTPALSSSGTERLRVNPSGVITIQNGANAVIQTLTDQATVTPDLSSGCNFTLTITGNRTIANPVNVNAGQAGSIFIIQGSGSNTLSWGANWDFPSGSAPTLSTASGAVDRVDYITRSATSIHAVFTANYS